MNTISKLTALTLLIALIFTGCEKDPLQPDNNALKLHTVADNLGMTYPFNSFVYDEDDLLVQILDNNGNLKYALEYNEDKKLVGANLYERNGELEREKSITWNGNAFTITYIEIGGSTEPLIETYELDSEGRIINYNGESVVWDSDESLTLDGEYILTFDKEYHHPLSGVNIAVLIATEDRTYFPDYYFLDNTYLPLKVDWSDGYFENYLYEFNDDGYPNKLTWYSGKEGDQYVEEYYFFEYESD